MTMNPTTTGGLATIEDASPAGASTWTALVSEELANPATSWSIGGFGALAEFHHSDDARIEQGTLVCVSGLGAIRIERTGSAIVRAYELLSARAGLWLHGAVLCTPQSAEPFGQSRVIVELGADVDAIRAQDRHALLFDLGLGLGNARFCVRTDASDLIARLRAAVGRNVFDIAGLFDQLRQLSPHRVVHSRLARIEVFQPIAQEGGSAPEGPHTHLLPELLRKHRTHPATLPVPSGFEPALSLYPSSPVQDQHGLVKAFDRGAYERFQRWLAAFGDRDFVSAKQQLFSWVRAGRYPGQVAVAARRIERNAWRIATRQLAQLDGMSEALAAWRARFDPNESRAVPGAH